MSFEKRFNDDFDLRSSPEAEELLYATPREDLPSSPDLRLPSDDAYKVNDDLDANPNGREKDGFESDAGCEKLRVQDYIQIRQRRREGSQIVNTHRFINPRRNRGIVVNWCSDIFKSIARGAVVVDNVRYLYS